MGPGAHPASYTMGTRSFPGVKQPGCSVDQPPLPSMEVKERVEIYIYSPSWPSWPVLGWTLPLLIYLCTLSVQDSCSRITISTKNSIVKHTRTLNKHNCLKPMMISWHAKLWTFYYYTILVECNCFLKEFPRFPKEIYPYTVSIF